MLHSESGGFLIGADYTAVARKMMTIQEWRRMLTGSNLGEKDSEMKAGMLCVCVCVCAV